MPAPIEFLDMSVSVTPPNGHFQPVPLTLGASWQTNDVRSLLISASGTTTDGNSTTLMIPMHTDPPTSPNFTAAYSLDPGNETRGCYYRYLQAGDSDGEIDFPKPPGWREFAMATVTARGVDPGTAPIAGLLSISYTVGDANAVVSSVSVPAAGTMVLFVCNTADPGGGWPSWPVAMGVPTGWKHMVATDKSGINFFAYDTNPALIVVGQSFSTSGSTGSVNIPVAQGAPAFAGMYMFFQPAPDVSVSVGAA